MVKEITLERLAKIPMIKQLETNESKSKITFVWDKTGRNELYALDVKTLEVEQLTDNHLPDFIVAKHFNDDRHIFYGKDKDGNQNFDIYMFNLETKESTQLTNTPKNKDYAITLSPDGKKILFVSNRNGQNNLYMMELSTKEVTQFTNFDRPYWGLNKWCDNGWIYLCHNDTDKGTNSDIWKIKEDGTELQLLFSMSKESREIFLDISKDNRYLAVTSNYFGLDQAGILDVETKEVKWLGNKECEEQVMSFLDDGTKLAVLRNKEAQLSLVIYDIKTNEEKTINSKGYVCHPLFGDPCIFLDGEVFYLETGPKVPMQLIRYNMKEEKGEVILKSQTEFSEEDFFDTEYIKYTSFDNMQIPALLYKPKIEKGKKYPALIRVHGGPAAHFRRLFDMEAQILALEGFVLLNPNIRGSTGYGKKFMELNYKDWGGADGKDVVWGKKYLETLEYVDPDRIGVFGGSYGGYMTFMQLTKHAEAGWKAGSSYVGISHLKTAFHNAPIAIKTFAEQTLGKYEENKDSWEKSSPLNYIEKIKAPIQILHGVNDPVCPIGESRQFRDKLLDMGWKEGTEGEKTFEYNEFTDEGHGNYYRQDRRIMLQKLIINFFKRRL